MPTISVTYLFDNYEHWKCFYDTVKPRLSDLDILDKVVFSHLEPDTEEESEWSIMTTIYITDMSFYAASVTATAVTLAFPEFERMEEGIGGAKHFLKLEYLIAALQEEYK